MDEQYSFLSKVSFWVKRFGFTEDVTLFIACQFALESNFGDSKLARDYNNFCGMRTPLVRISMATNFGDGSSTWARYNNLPDCIIDFMLCLQYHKPCSDIHDSIPAYCRFISRFYCPERDYISHINNLYSQFKNYKK